MITDQLPYMRRAVSTISNPREDGSTVFVSDLTCGHCKAWGLPAGVYMPIVTGPVFLHCERCAAKGQQGAAEGLQAAEGVTHGV